MTLTFDEAVDDLVGILTEARPKPLPGGYRAEVPLRHFRAVEPFIGKYRAVWEATAKEYGFFVPGEVKLESLDDPLDASYMSDVGEDEEEKARWNEVMVVRVRRDSFESAKLTTGEFNEP
jgi:hypothetical protein